MEIFVISGLVNGIVGASLALAVFIQNRREPANRAFSLLALAIAVWSFGYWQWLSSSDYFHAIFWINIFTVGSIFIPVFYFWWVVTLLNLRKQFGWLIAILFAVSVGLNVLLFTSDLLIRGVEPRFIFSFWPIPGRYYLFYIMGLYGGLVVSALLLLLKRFHRAADATLRAQARFIFWGSLVGFGGGATNFFLWYKIPIPPYINFSVTLGLFFFGYAAIKHGLFNIRVIAAELLIFIIWIFLLIQTVLAETFQQKIVNGSLLILVVGFGVLLIRSVFREVRSKEEIQNLAIKLEAANTELTKLDAAKSEFISIASHQLRAPLTVIKGYVSLLLEGSLGQASDLAKESMKKVFISAEQLVRLVADMLDLSRIEGGRLRYDMKEVSVDPIVAEVVSELEPTAKAKGLIFTFDNLNAGKRMVNADPDKYREVAMNLVDNAIKYTASGRVSVTLAPEVKEGKEFLVLKVHDTGLGVSSGEIAKLFAKFARTEEARRIRPDGMGLGLYLVKKIVEDHGGWVKAESPGLGRGSTFTVAVPTQ